MSLLQAFLECLLGNAGDGHPVAYGNNYHAIDRKLPPDHSTEDIASSFLSTLFTAEKAGHDLECRLQNIVQPYGWRDGLAERILKGIEAAVNAGAAMGGAMKDAFDKVRAVAEAFVREHPILAAELATLIAIGILVILAEWVIVALGFEAEGIAAGKSSVSDRGQQLMFPRFVGSKVAINIS
jgi:hypothetical protein